MGSEAAFIAIWERLKGVMVNDTFIKHELKTAMVKTALKLVDSTCLCVVAVYQVCF